MTGGVLSGLGKGIASASIGNLLARTHRVVAVKCEGYLNVDPGTMNPLEHGEVFVLEDGEEADMDFGHYERFIGRGSRREHNITMGKVFEHIRMQEREGVFLGKTVQFVPHVTDHIKDRWRTIAKEDDAQILIVEIGGTVGDIETQLHIEAARQMMRDYGRQDVMFIHLTYVPFPERLGEFKTKPTQQSLILLREHGIAPNIVLARSDHVIPDHVRGKIALFAGLPDDRVLRDHDVGSIYEIPILLEEQGLLEYIGDHFGIAISHEDAGWKDAVIRGKDGRDVTIAICGKYTSLEDSYASVVEAIHHAAAHTGKKARILFLETTQITSVEDAQRALTGVDAVIVPGGFGSRGIEGKLAVIEYCRTHDIPYLGICYGLQLAVIEFARNVLGLDAHTTEVDETTPHPVVDILPDQIGVTRKGATMRLGAYDAYLKEGSRVHALYGSGKVSERHRHRYEVNPAYHERLTNARMHLCGMSPDGSLVEFIELDHRFFVASQGHIELKSSLLSPAPLFVGLLDSV